MNLSDNIYFNYRSIYLKYIKEIYDKEKFYFLYIILLLLNYLHIILYNFKIIILHYGAIVPTVKKNN